MFEQVLPESATGRALVLFILLVCILTTSLGLYHNFVDTTELEREPVTEDVVQSSISTQATVTRESVVYEPGESLSEQTHYPVKAAPGLSVKILSSVSDRFSGKVVTHRVELVSRVSTQDTVVASKTLISKSQSNKNAASSTLLVDIENIKKQQQKINEEFDRGADVSTSVLVDVNVTGIESNLTYTSQIKIVDGFYQVKTPPSSKRVLTTVVGTRTVEVESDDRHLLLNTLTAASWVIFISILSLYAYIQRENSWEKQVSSYDEWITGADLSRTSYKSAIHVETIDGIVELAIDMDSRVLYDKHDKVLLVKSEGEKYVHKYSGCKIKSELEAQQSVTIHSSESKND